MFRSLIIVLLIASTAFAEEYTIRNTRWGMTPEEVKKIEKWKYGWKTEGNLSKLSYTGELKKGVECYLTYSFIDNKLMSINYRMIEDAEYKQILLFSFFSDSLVKKYGQPEKPPPLDLSKKLSDDQLLELVSRQDGTYGRKRWKIHGGQTGLVLFGISATLNITYSHKDFNRLKRLVEENKKRDEIYNLQDDL